MQLIKLGTSLDDEGKIDILSLKIASSELLKDGQPMFDIITEGKSISSLKREIGIPTVQKVLFALLSTINDYINAKSPLTKSQCIEFSFELMECNDLKVDDFFVFVELFKRGHFLKIYERVDPLVLKEAWREYLRERGDFFFNQHLDFKSREKQEGNSQAYHDMLKLANILASEEQFLNNKTDKKENTITEDGQ